MCFVTRNDPRLNKTRIESDHELLSLFSNDKIERMKELSIKDALSKVEKFHNAFGIKNNSIPTSEIEKRRN